MSAPQRPVDGNHALLVGNIAGFFLRGDVPIPTTVEHVMLGSDYSNQLIVKRQHGTYVVTVEKETPEQECERLQREEQLDSGTRPAGEQHHIEIEWPDA